MSEHELVEPFEIDDGQLNGLTPQEIFTLGVEWQMIRERLSQDEAFSQTVNSANSDRLMNLCKRHGRRCRLTWIHDDFDGWRELTVEGKS